MADQNISASDLWLKTVDMVKDRVNNRSLWITMEKAVGLAIEDNIFIVGLPARYSNEAGHLNVSENHNAIEQCASRLAGRALRVRIIEGETVEDWHYTQKRDARVEAMQNTTYERRERKEAESQTWDTLHDYVARAYSSTSLRALPQSKARYLTDMLYALSDAMDTLVGDTPDENSERMMARVIDRVATNAEVPATLVALELERLRTWRKQNPE